MKILLTPSGFKESLSADKVAQFMKRGILNVIPYATITSVPLVDGGEGFTEAMVRWTNGTLHELEVTGPVNQRVEAKVGFIGQGKKRTAVIEMASAAGLKFVPREQRNPLQTTSYGVGELIKEVLNMGAKQVLVGCGDSGVSDGGIGMAQALGVRFLDDNHEEIDTRQGAKVLPRISSVDLASRDKRLDSITIDVACNWHNILCGPDGVARVYGPQKGASKHQVLELERGLEHYASLIKKTKGCCVRNMNGGGASGGLGSGLYAWLGARLHPRYDVIMKYMDIERYIKESDLIFTAEGSIDFQTPRGKIPAEVASIAKTYSKPVIVIAGTIGKGAKINYQHGIDVYTSIIQTPTSLEEAMLKTDEWITESVETSMRTVLVGLELAASVPSSGRLGRVSI